ncbi:MAG: flagellar basal body-associated FliL family protein [Burkholderiales bacterium]|nr:flagellar basal body-associated FliL family protein [Burkholderiales bacterium]
MSTAAATAPASPAAAAPPAKGKKKLLLIAGMGLLVLALAGVGAVLVIKKRQQAAVAAAEGDAPAGAPAAEAKHEPAAPPTFVPLDPFTVNLADHDAERYAQVGVTLEVKDAKVAEEVKAFMPAIRNNVLMAIADRTAAELAGREGKAALAARIRRETLRALGYALPPEAGESASAAAHGARRQAKESELPVTAVQFSNFIIQ